MTDYENENGTKPCKPTSFRFRKKIKNPSDSDNQFSCEEEKPKPIRVSKKNLPHFNDKPDEDVRIFVNKYAMIARLNYWGDKELTRHFHMCLDQTAFSWLMLKQF